MTKDEALAVLEAGHTEIRALLGRLPVSARTRSGLGGGEWSPKDLVAHLAFWERHALEALTAWSEGRTAPIDQAFRTQTLAEINASGVSESSARSWRAVLGRADRTHAELVAAIAAIPEKAWNAPATDRSRRQLGTRLGSIVAGPGGAFRHAFAHIGELTVLVNAS